MGGGGGHASGLGGGPIRGGAMEHPGHLIVGASHLGSDWVAPQPRVAVADVP